MHSTPYKRQIDEFIHLNKFPKTDIKYIYGGVTKQTLSERKEQHIRDEKPLKCNDNWLIHKIIPLTVKIEDISKKEEYKDLIKKVENYLINKLDENYDIKCVNAR
jgi:hypothetical protein